MGIINIDRVGTKGFIRDIPGYQSPFEAWDDVRNVRFEDGAVVKGNGWTQTRAASVEPYQLFPVITPTGAFFAYAGLTKVYGWVASTQADITNAGGDYTGAANNYWNGGMFNGVPIFNNGVDPPQMWTPISLSQKLQDLADWPANTTARVIRPFKNFLVGLDIVRPGLTDSRLVKWGSSADPGTLPASWDHTDATNDAGENALSEGTDSLVDCKQLGDYNIIYGETSTYAMSYIGPPYIFAFSRRFSQSGIIAQDCVQQFKNLHFVVTLDDIIVHNGSSQESIISGRLRRWLFSNINPDSYRVSRTVIHNQNKEIWFLFPYGSTTTCNMVLIWNWRDDTWTVREVPGTRAVMPIQYEERELAPWADVAGAWSAQTDPWSTSVSQNILGSVFFAPLSTPTIQLVDNSGQVNGVDFDSYVERTGIDVETAFDGQLYHDPLKERWLTSVWPYIEAAVGTEFTIKVGHSATLGGTVTWDDTGVWTAGDSPKIDLHAQGRYLAIRITHSGSEADWRLIGYGLDISKVGVL